MMNLKIFYLKKYHYVGLEKMECQNLAIQVNLYSSNRWNYKFKRIKYFKVLCGFLWLVWQLCKFYLQTKNLLKYFLKQKIK